MNLIGYISGNFYNEIKNYIDVLFLESQGIIPLCNSKDRLNFNLKDISKIKTLESLKIYGDKFILDFFCDCQNIYDISGSKFVESIYKENIHNFNSVKVKFIEKEKIEDLEFKEALRVVFNKILKCFHNKNIYLINLYLMNNIEDKESEEYVYTSTINKIMKRYCNIAKEILPDLNIVNIEAEYDFKNKKLNLLKETISYLKKRLNEKMEIFKGERVFSSYYPIRYYYEKAKFYNKKKLIIVFSSFSNDKPKYNYISTLKTVDCNKLFILDDYGIKGSYYLGLDGNFNIENSVISLITKIMSENNIDFKDVIVAGSSKGGTAALYYGLKYNFGNIIAGAPQYKIGTYLCDLSIKDYANDIFGDYTEGNRIKYDNLIRINASTNKNSKINILTGEGDPQYKNVLKEFENIIKEYNLNATIKMSDISKHSEVANIFPDYLNENIKKIFERGCYNNKLLDYVIKNSIYLKKFLKRRCKDG